MVVGFGYLVWRLVGLYHELRTVTLTVSEGKGLFVLRQGDGFNNCVEARSWDWVLEGDDVATSSFVVVVVLSSYLGFFIFRILQEGGLCLTEACGGFNDGIPRLILRKRSIKLNIIHLFIRKHGLKHLLVLN